MKKYLLGCAVALCALFALLGIPTYALAEEASQLGVTPQLSSGADSSSMLDGSYDTYVSLEPNESIVVAGAGSTIGSIYVRFYAVPGSWTLNYVDSAGQSHVQPCGQNDFLHEYVAIEGGASSAELVFPMGARICTFDAYTLGSPPASVQVWQPSCAQADFMVCSTHADDEILWLGGVLATYAGGQGLQTQVVYMTNYWDAAIGREHEKLDGLWTIGVRNYPVNAPFDDTYAGSLDEALQIYDQDAVTGFFTEQVRRFKPLVVVCQDFNGEYGHGGHQLLALAVQGAVDHAAEANYYPESAQAYGVWDVPKTYYHLYSQNEITLDLHQPINNLGGQTAIEAAREAYKQHVSQQWTWFYLTDDPDDPYAEQINCSKFGLYRSTVGLDTGNDMLEHVTTYEQQAEILAQQQAQEQAQRQAEQRAQQLAAEQSTPGGEEASQDQRDSSLQNRAGGFAGLLIPLVAGIVIFVVVLLIAFKLVLR